MARGMDKDLGQKLTEQWNKVFGKEVNWLYEMEKRLSPMKMEELTMGNGQIINETAKELWYLPQDQLKTKKKKEDYLLNMLEDGQRINWKDTEQWNMPMEEYTLVNGKKANDMVKALCHIPMGESGKESGQAIN